MTNKIPAQTEPYSSTQMALPMSLLRTRELVMDRFRPMLAARGVTEQQWRVLRILDEEGEADSTTIADRANLKLPSLTRIARTLSDADLIAPKKDPNDKRRALLAITEKGRKLLADSADESRAIYGEMRAAIGEERLQTLLDLLVDVRRALRDKA